MLDPKEQAKGGFRAQLARQREAQDAIMTAADVGAAAKAPDATSTPAEGQADGAGASSPAETAASTTPGARQPKRWH